jgi:phage gp16-like protein
LRFLKWWKFTLRSSELWQCVFCVATEISYSSAVVFFKTKICQTLKPQVRPDENNKQLRVLEKKAEKTSRPADGNVIRDWVEIYTDWGVL